VVCLGIYFTLEGKWYDFLEWLNNYIPVLGITDRIDDIVPSFLVFSALLLILIVGILFAFLLNPGQSIFDAELTIVTKTGAPLEGVKIILSQECTSMPENSSIEIISDKEGKAKFKACSEFVQIKTIKENYIPIDTTLFFGEEKEQTITLSPKTIPTKLFNAKIKSTGGEIITRTKLEMICTSSGKVDRKEITSKLNNNMQPQTGYEFELPESCDSIQLHATAQGYKEQMTTIGLNEENKTIILERSMNEGEVIFTADSPLGVQEGAQIIVLNEFEQEIIFETQSNGQAKATLAEGTYSYNASVKGFIESGEFNIIINRTTDVNIYFKGLVSVPRDLNAVKNIYLKLMDNNSPVPLAIASIFFTKENDTNKLSEAASSIDGIIGPKAIIDTAGKTFTAIIKASGYETKIAPIERRTKAEGPQVVQMNQGGAKLTVRVIDDMNMPVQGVQTVLYNSQFPAPFEKAITTDKNGVTYYSGLPSGTYRITAKTDTEEGEINNISISSSDKEITLRLVIGRGTIEFSFFDETNNKTNLSCKILQKDSNGFSVLADKNSSQGKITTPTLKAGAQIKIAVEDGNYIPFESLVYTVKRGAQQRNIFLRRANSLPNDNEAQLMLRQVYDTNPTLLRETFSTRILPGKSYFLLFDLVLNKAETGDPIANFYIAPKIKETLDNTSNFAIQGAYSINNSYYAMTSRKTGFLVDNSSANPGLVDNNAKQLNSILPNQTGLKLIPVIVEIRVDENAVGKAEIFFQPKFKDYYGIENSKEFVIGQAFCLFDCPVFLFSNYLLWNSNGTLKETPLSEHTQKIQMGDSYSIKTIVENLGDEAIGSTDLLTGINGDDSQILAFTGDKNFISQQVTINPVSETQPKESGLMLKKSSLSSVRVYQSLQKIVNGTDKLKNYNGNENILRFEVTSKNDLNMLINATGMQNTIFEKTNYPFFFIKTFYYKTKKPVKAFWTATIDGAGMPIKTGVTDENGIQLLSFDLSNITAGQKIIFTATDENNSNPARLEIIVSKPFAEPTPDETECISVKINGVDVKTMDYPTLELNYGKAGEIVIDSNCSVERTIAIVTDLKTDATLIKISPNEKRSVKIEALTKNR